MTQFRAVNPRTYSSKPEEKERKEEKSEIILASILEGEGSEAPSLRPTAPRPKLDPQTRKNLGASERAVATHAREDSGSESAEDAANVVEISRTVMAPDDKEPAAPKQKVRPILQRLEKKTSIQKVVSEKPKRRTGLVPRQRQLPRPRPLEFGQLPSLPQIPSEPEKTIEANLDDELLNFDTIETLLDPEADDTKIQAILSGTREEHEISSDSASQREIEPTPSNRRDLNKVTKELDELKKYVNLELRHPKKRTEHSRSSNVASQILAPATSKKMARTVETLIEGSEGDRPKSFRVLNILLCAAGGTRVGNLPMICAPVMYPETDDCARRLIATPDAYRYEYLKALFDQLSPYLTREQDQLVRGSLANIYSVINISKSLKLVEVELFALRRKLEAELSSI